VTAARARRPAPLALLLVAVAVLLVLQLRDDGPASSGAPVSRGVAAVPDPRAEILLGATTAVLAQDSYRPWRPADLASIDRFERTVQHHVGVVMWFSDWESVARPDVAQLRAVAARGSIPEITWEPWDSRRPPDRSKYRLREIIDGRFDAYVRRWATDLARYGGPVRLRFAHEMNGNWYPWTEVSNGNRPGEYARAWRHVWQLFHDAGATNVEWVWSPVAPLRLKPGEYPGDRYVDRVGLSGFNGGRQIRFQQWRPFGEIFGPALRQLREIAPGKPVELSEIGVAEAGGDKAAWLGQMFDGLRRHPEIDALVWFDLDKRSDWRVATSPAARRAFARGVRSPRFGQRVRRFAVPGGVGTTKPVPSPDRSVAPGIIEQVDALGGHRVGVVRTLARRYALVEVVDGRFSPLDPTTSTCPPLPDLGRDGDAGVAVVYRRCGADGRARLMRRALRPGTSAVPISSLPGRPCGADGWAVWRRTVVVLRHGPAARCGASGLYAVRDGRARQRIGMGAVQGGAVDLTSRWIAWVQYRPTPTGSVTQLHVTRRDGRPGFVLLRRDNTSRRVFGIPEVELDGSHAYVRWTQTGDRGAEGIQRIPLRAGAACSEDRDFAAATEYGTTVDLTGLAVADGRIEYSLSRDRAPTLFRRSAPRFVPAAPGRFGARGLGCG
jgi:beta-mannanase